MSEQNALTERAGNEACELLVLLRPWELQPPEVRSACVRLTMTLARLGAVLPAGAENGQARPS